jgi:hypothetical protein
MNFLCGKNCVSCTQEADEIRQGADETKNLAGQLRDDAEELATRVAVTGSRVKELEDQAAQDEGLTTEVWGFKLIRNTLIFIALVDIYKLLENESSFPFSRQSRRLVRPRATPPRPRRRLRRRWPRWMTF